MSRNNSADTLIVVPSRLNIARAHCHLRPACLTALAAIAIVTLAGCSGPRSAGRASTGSADSQPGSVASITPTVSSSPAPSLSSATVRSTQSADPAATPVHVSLLQSDGGVYGVGMPIVAYFNRRVTDASAFETATTVTVNGTRAAGAWFWQRSGRDGQSLEAHYRLRTYWPARAKILLDLPVAGLPAGAGLAYDDSVTLSIATGPSHISSVDCATEKMVVTADGLAVRTLPVSCGKAMTPTYTGVKLVMQKGEQVPGSEKVRPDGTVRMRSNNPADPYDLMVPWSVRLTASGEYAHAASWNGGNIGLRSTSNGCTNLNVSDAEWFYRFSRVGDVLTYGHTGGKTMPSWDGYGDWNLSWAVWKAGGAVSATGR